MIKLKFGISVGLVSLIHTVMGVFPEVGTAYFDIWVLMVFIVYLLVEFYEWLMEI